MRSVLAATELVALSRGQPAGLLVRICARWHGDVELDPAIAAGVNVAQWPELRARKLRALPAQAVAAKAALEEPLPAALAPPIRAPVSAAAAAPIRHPRERRAARSVAIAAAQEARSRA